MQREKCRLMLGFRCPNPLQGIDPTNKAFAWTRAMRALGYEGEAAYIEQWIERAGDGGPIRDLSGGEPPAGPRRGPW